MRPGMMRIAATCIALAALAAAPWWLGPYPQYVLSLWLIFALSAIGLNIPIGLGKIFSFGHGAFMLIGAYATAMPILYWNWPISAAIPAAVVLAAIVGIVIGLPALRLTSFSLAIVTLSFAFVLFQVVKAFDFTGGPQGLFMPDTALTRLLGGRAVHLLVFACFVAGFLGYWSLSRSKTGRALRVLGENPIVAQSLGVHLLYYRVLCLVLSAVYAALAGGLLALLTNYVGPETFSAELSVNMFAAVFIGGVGTLLGPILGALFVVLIPELFQSVQNLSQIIYAALFCLAATLFPGGLAEIASKTFTWLAGLARGRDAPVSVR
jgi:branched-chain amino acid transport system permease protein